MMLENAEYNLTFNFIGITLSKFNTVAYLDVSIAHYILLAVNYL